MTSINRPGLFAQMGPVFTAALGNVDVTLVVDGVQASAPVRGILRQMRSMDMLPEDTAMIEGVTHTLSMTAAAAGALESDRDDVIIGGVTYQVRALTDDGRAMVTLYLTGDI